MTRIMCEIAPNSMKAAIYGVILYVVSGGDAYGVRA